LRASSAAPLLLLALSLSDGTVSSSSSASRSAPSGPCEGDRPTPPRALYLKLRSAAFPGSPYPDAAVHVPPGFDATRSPGLVLYFHGWKSCVAAALADEDVPCTDGDDGDQDDRHPAAGLAAQMDDARVNALLLAVELRVDASTGETGELATAGGMRAMLREVLHERLAGTLGCTLELDAIDRIVVVAHSGGYQAAATVLQLGDLPQISEVILLDALYGADDVFRSWVTDAPSRRYHRFVDLYTCCGGTLDRSRAMAELAHRVAGGTSEGMVFDDDGDADLDPGALTHPFVFKRVATPHGALPRAHLRALLDAAGFSRIEATLPSHAG
jgi:hypothetical protein